jgi:flagellar protein FlaI
MSKVKKKQMGEEIDGLKSLERETEDKLRRLDDQRTETAAYLEAVEKKKKRKIGEALSSIKKGYISRLLGGKGIKILAPAVSGIKEETMGRVTTIPKLTARDVTEIEIQNIIDGYSYVRINYDTRANEYKYEAIEPKLLDEEVDILEVLKEVLVESLELIEEEDEEHQEAYLRRIVDGLLRELDISLHPVSKERIMYFILRDFIRYGPIDVSMIDINVEDISCDGVGVPLYIYHRKYGSIPSNLVFDSPTELDSFVVWLSQKCGKHISVAQPMLDATVPDEGSKRTRSRPWTC